MDCPSCEYTFKVSFAEYLKNILGHHECPGCTKRMKLVYSLKYIFSLLVVVIVCSLLPGLAVIYYMGNLWIGMIATIAGILFVAMPIDYWYDNTIRKTTAL